MTNRLPTNPIFACIPFLALAIAAAAHSGPQGDPCATTRFPDPFTPGTMVFAGRMADLNHTGVMRLVLWSSLGVGIVQDSDGDGSFEALQMTPALPSAGTPRDLVVADIDGDGDLDVATLSEAGSSTAALLYYRNDGGVLHGVASYLAGSNARQLAAGDLNGDGKAELVTGAGYPLSIYIYRGNAGVPLAPITLSAPRRVLGIALGDIDGDGDLDIIASCRADGQDFGQIFVQRNDGNFNFTPLPPVNIAAWDGRLAVGDLDGDGDADVAVLTYQGYALLYSTGGQPGSAATGVLG